MAQMIVRNIDDETAARFKARAKAAGKSAEQLLRELVEEEACRNIEGILNDLDAIRETTKGKPVVDPVASIREDRDSGYGRL
jgi:plasmid stability protein